MHRNILVAILGDPGAGRGRADSALAPVPPPPAPSRPLPPPSRPLPPPPAPSRPPPAANLVRKVFYFSFNFSLSLRTYPFQTKLSKKHDICQISRALSATKGLKFQDLAPSPKNALRGPCYVQSYAREIERTNSSASCDALASFFSAATTLPLRRARSNAKATARNSPQAPKRSNFRMRPRALCPAVPCAVGSALAH